MKIHISFYVNKIENYSNRFVITSQIVLPFIYGIINLCMKRKYLLMCSVCAGGSDKRKKLCNSMFTELFPFLKKRCVRDSNPWPHAWQACILTNWTNAPKFHFFIAVSLDCGCKGSCFFYICNSWERFFSSFSFICWL